MSTSKPLEFQISLGDLRVRLRPRLTDIIVLVPTAGYGLLVIVAPSLIGLEPVKGSMDLLGAGLIAFACFSTIVRMIRSGRNGYYEDRDSQSSYALHLTHTLARDVEVVREFLAEEARRIRIADQTLKRLQQEKDQLAPVLAADRDLVNAVLSANATATQQRAWIERVWGFTLGIGASLIASVIYEYAK